MRLIKRAAHKALRWPVLKAAAVTAAALGRVARGDEAHDIFQRHGFHLLRRHYYLPIPEAEDVPAEFWERESEMVGVDLNAEAALAFAERELAPYVAEFRARFPLRPAEGAEFHLLNSAFMAVDAHLYYSLVRHLRPRRVIEIGSGQSTRVAAAACLQNAEEGAGETRLTAIEPYPPPHLKAGLAGLSELVERKVQDVPLSEFAALEANDILFIDSTHVLRAGGDVQYEFCEVLPRLRPGVHVHVHDISLPRPYPRAYFDAHWYWNEQYLLQAFLAFNSRFEVVWPGNYLMLRQPARLRALFPEIEDMRAEFPSSEPTSFWMRVKG